MTSTDSGADDPAPARRHRRHGAHLLRRHLRRQRHPSPAGLQQHHGAARWRPRRCPSSRSCSSSSTRRSTAAAAARWAPIRSPAARPRSPSTRWGTRRSDSPTNIRTTPAATRPATTIIRRASRPSRTSRPTPTAHTLKWRWAVAAATAFPTMSNPELRHGRHAGRARCPPARSGCSKARTTTTAAAYRPEYDCKMRNLSVPFCRVCRQVIWNRIGPLATLQATAAHADQRRRALPRASRRVRGRRQRPHDEQLVGPVERLGRLVPRAGRHRLTRRSGIAGHRRSPATPGTSTCSPSAPTTASTAAGGMRGSGWQPWFPIGDAACAGRAPP